MSEIGSTVSNGREWQEHFMQRLSEPARAALERKFIVGAVTAEDVKPGEEEFIGCVAVVWEGSGTDARALLKDAADVLNRQAEAGRLVGMRSLPELVFDGRNGPMSVTCTMRVMLRPEPNFQQLYLNGVQEREKLEQEQRRLNAELGAHQVQLASLKEQIRSLIPSGHDHCDPAVCNFRKAMELVKG